MVGMQGAAESRHGGSVFRAVAAEPLTVVERSTLLVLVAAGVALEVGSFIVSGGAGLTSSLFALLLTALFALFAWKPVFAVASFGVAMISAFFLDNAPGTLLALAVAAGCVARTASSGLMLGFGGGLLLATAAVAHPATGAPIDVAGYLVVSTVSGAVGLLLRAASIRARRLRLALAHGERRASEALALERRRIADELHDGIAHDLTVINMHARVLQNTQDADLRRESERVIEVAARNGLADLHRVIALGEEPQADRATHASGLPGTFEAAVRALEPTGRKVVFSGDPADVRLPSSTGSALAWVLREAVTNVLKHSARGPVEIRLAFDEDVVLSVRSPVPPSPRSDAPTGGRGVARMRERMLSVGGGLNVGTDAERQEWVVTARPPLH